MTTNGERAPQQYRLQQQVSPLRLAVLVSGTGSNLQALIDAIAEQQLPHVEIALVVSNQANAQGLHRALRHKLPALFLPWQQREEAEARLSALIKLFQVDLIVLAGWMRIFTREFTLQFAQRMINLHPALLPDSGTDETYTTSEGHIIPALRGLHVVQRALDAGLSVTGSTVHYVTPEVDAGPVICRAEVPIEQEDTAETLHERLKQAEHRLVIEAVRRHAVQRPK